LEWGADPAYYEAEFARIIGASNQVRVTRSLTSSGSLYGMTYSFSFIGDFVAGGNTDFWLESNGEVSGVQYNGTENEQDLLFNGDFSGGSAAVFSIIYIGKSGRNMLLHYYAKTPTGSSGSSLNISHGSPQLLSNNIYVTLNSFGMHSHGDTWTLYFSSCSPLPIGATATLLPVLAVDNGAKEITLSQAYVGDPEGAMDCYLVNQVFRIRLPQNDILKIVVKDEKNTKWDNGPNPGYCLKYKWRQTPCIHWNIMDADMEQVLWALRLNVTVTRHVDSFHAPGGYIYSIYFNGDSLRGAEFGPPGTFDGLSLNMSCCKVKFDSASRELVLLTRVAVGNRNDGVFTAVNLPLGLATNAKLPSKYLGSSGNTTLLQIFRVNGLLHMVEFATNLGNVVLNASYHGLLGANASVTVKAPPLVRGYEPLQLTISNLMTGIPYYFKVSSWTSMGHSPDSNVVTAIPSGPPGPIAGLVASVALYADEVQEVILSSSYSDIIQTITTTATHTTEVQMVQTFAEYGDTIQGHFTLRFPEVQSILVSGQSPIDGNYSLSFLNYQDGGSGFLSPNSQLTTCLSWDAEASDMEAALEALSNIQDVTVVRSCDGTVVCDFGFSYTVSFIGLEDSGNVQLLQVGLNPMCAGVQAYGNRNSSITIQTVSEFPAVGTNTEMYYIQVASEIPLTSGTGSYRLEVFNAGGYQSTDCLAWDADAAEMTNFLERLPNVDSVLVTRQALNARNLYGYGYSVIFDGSGMQLWSGLNQSSEHANLRANFSNCSVFSSTVSNVVTPLSLLGVNYSIQITVLNKASTVLGFNASGDTLTHLLELMPDLKSPLLVMEGYLDDQNGKTWTLSFSSNDGDVPELLCNANFATGDCKVNTLVNGNQIGGYFLLNESAELPFDVSSQQMEAAIKAFSGIDLVTVTRTTDGGRGNYVWAITFSEVLKRVYPLVPLSSLTGINAEITVQQTVKQNLVSGDFALSFRNESSGLIDCYTPATATHGVSVQDILQKLSSFQNVSVSEMDNVDGSVSLLVTFSAMSVQGNLDIDSTGLKGVNAVGTIQEVTKGSLASGYAAALSFRATSFCSNSLVLHGICGSPVTGYIIEMGTQQDFQKGTFQTVQLKGENFLHKVQVINIISSTLEVSGTFQLAFKNEKTVPIRAGASALEVKAALEKLPGIQTVHVSMELSKVPLPIEVDLLFGSFYAFCADEACAFLANGLVPCALIQLNGNWFRIQNDYDGSESQIPLSEASDCSVAVAYGGESVDSVPVFGWGNGNSWTVTLLKYELPLSLLSSPVPALFPEDALVYITGQDCNKCYHLPEGTDWEKLEIGVQYFIRVWAYNSFGALSTPVNTSVIPSQIPFAPENTSVEVTSGQSVNVLFCPPRIDSSDVTNYNIQWDTSNDFSNFVSRKASCKSAGFGSCVVLALRYQALKCPFSFEIDQLTNGTRFFFRVAAQNSVSAQVLIATGHAEQNWSPTMSAVPHDVPPSPPTELHVYVVNGNTAQVQFGKPLQDGGSSITGYFFDVDTTSSFDSTIQLYLNASDFSTLQKDGLLCGYLNGLTEGVPLYFRISAVSILGSTVLT